MSKSIKTWVVSKLLHGESVDFVTYANAGGTAEALEAFRESVDNALSPLARKQLQEEGRHMSNEQNVAEQLATERAAKVTAESERDTALETRDKAQKEAKEAKEKVAEAEKKGRIAVNKTALEEALGKCKTLPDPSKQRIRDRFKDFSEATGLEAQLAEAIKAEEKFLKDVGAKVGKPGAAGDGNKGKPGGVQGMGEANAGGGDGDGEGDPEADHKALIESYQRGGMTEAAAKEAAEESRFPVAAKK
jgi:hypothetical protein